MTKIFLVLFLLLTSTGLAQEQAAKTASLPQDVKDWVARQELCEHFGGEGGDTSKSRAISLQLRSHEACFGVLDEQKSLAHKYSKNQSVLRALARVDVSWLGEQSDVPRGTPFAVAELAARAVICSEVKNDLDNTTEDISRDAFEAYGELCLTLEKDRRVLLKEFAKVPSALRRLRSIKFSP